MQKEALDGLQLIEELKRRATKTGIHVETIAGTIIQQIYFAYNFPPTQQISATKTKGDSLGHFIPDALVFLDSPPENDFDDLSNTNNSDCTSFINELFNFDESRPIYTEALSTVMKRMILWITQSYDGKKDQKT